MKKIVILGTGGNCVDILDTLLDINDARNNLVYDCVGFLDDNPEKWGQTVLGIKVLGPLKEARNMKDCFFVFGIGSTANFWKRRDILSKLEIEDDLFETIIHPTASVSRMASIGLGTIIFQHVTVTSNAKIGRHVYVLPNSIISHDSVIGDYSCIAGGVCVSGNVRVGEGVYLGTNSAIKDGVVIANHCLIGMGSVVLNDVSLGTVSVGNPAKPIRNI